MTDYKLNSNNFWRHTKSEREDLLDDYYNFRENIKKAIQSLHHSLMYIDHDSEMRQEVIIAALDKLSYIEFED